MKFRPRRAKPTGFSVLILVTASLQEMINRKRYSVRIGPASALWVSRWSVIIWFWIAHADYERRV
jgi:hypothetical protein